VDVGDGEGEGDEDSWANLGTREVLKARGLGFDLLYSRYILFYTRRCLGTIVSAAAPAVASVIRVRRRLAAGVGTLGKRSSESACQW